MWLATIRPHLARPVPLTATRASAGSGIPWYGLALAGLGLLVLGGAGGALVIARRRPRPPIDAVEAELQDMITEQRTIPPTEVVPVEVLHSSGLLDDLSGQAANGESDARPVPSGTDTAESEPVLPERR